MINRGISTMFISESSFTKILNYFIIKAFADGKKLTEIFKYKKDLEGLLRKVSFADENSKLVVLDDSKINSRYKNINELFDSDLYTYCLIENFLNLLLVMNDLNDQELEIKNLLKLNTFERLKLNQFSKTSFNRNV